MSDGVRPDAVSEFDWSTTPLGPMEAWPARLRAYADVMAGSRFPTAIYWGRDLRLLYNDAYLDMLGHSPCRLGQTMREAWPEIYDRFSELADKVFDGEACVCENAKVETRRDGVLREAYFTFSWSPLSDDDGKVSGIFATVMETTAKVLAETEQRHFRDRLAQLFENASTFMALLSEPAHIIDYANPAFRSLAGDRELTGNSVRMAFPELQHQGFFDILDEAYRTGRPFKATGVKGRIERVRGQPPELRYLDVLLQPIFDAGGRSTGIFVEGVDVTDRVMSEEAAQQSRRDAQEASARLDLMLNSANEYAIMSIDTYGRVESWNPGAERIFGHAAREAVGRTGDFIFPEEDRASGAYAHELTKASTEGRAADERWHVRKSGERFYASGVTTAMRDAAGNLIGYVKITRDMTEQKHAEEEIISARNAAEAANVAKSEFLANMSHEIRTPMNAIIGLSNLLPMSGPLNDRQQQYVTTLKTSADGLLALINDLLDVSKIEANATEIEHVSFSFADILHDVSNMMAVRTREKGLDFTVNDGCVNGRSFIGDPTRIRQVLLNLVGNAIKFTDSGGIHMSVECEPHPAPGVEKIYIRVRDTGIGKPPDKVNTIFDKFTQADSSINRRFGGTGLGLAITRALVQAMNGEINVESTLGEGATFTVCLPLTVAKPEDVAKTDLSLKAVIETTQQIGHILLVEDDPTNVMVARSFLERFGYQIDLADTGAKALEALKLNAYDIVLMDVQMPGMDGLETTCQIREYEKQTGSARVPIVGMTAHALSGDRDRCLSAGMDDYISKPFEPDDLRKKLKEVRAMIFDTHWHQLT